MILNFIFLSYSDKSVSTMAPFVTFLENLDTAITNSVIKVYCVRVFGGLPDDSRDVNTEAVFYDAKVSLKFPILVKE